MNESNLYKASLIDTECRKTDLSNSNLYLADVQRAKFEFANLKEADLWVVDANGAYFVEANLQSANLNGANIKGACLKSANLRDVTGNIYALHCDEKTMLPDGTYWQKKDDLKKFIDPAHPKFFEVRTPYWQENNVDKTSE